MSSRRRHANSRRGCTVCKRRHIKCDETGPPCGRCKIRGDSCEYASTPSSTRDDDAISTPSSQCSTAHNTARFHQVVFPENRHLLELQLMHRWTASTFKCCCTPGSGDDEVWQFCVPQLAIEYDYLLYGLLSLSAFETARLAQTDDTQRYIESATEYHSSALSSFRVQISVINSDNIDAAFCMSLMLLVLAFASAQTRATRPSDYESDGMVQNVLTHVELLRGCTPIINSQQGYLSQNQYIKKMKPFQDLPRAPLDPGIEEALVKLAELNDKRLIPLGHGTEQRRSQQCENREGCKNALDFLRTLFEKCIDDSTRGYALGWLNIAGDGYVKAVKDGDAIALLILTYWGVLVESCGHQVWWADQFGSLLVADIARRPLFKDVDVAAKDLIVRAQHYVDMARSHQSNQRSNR